MCYVGLDVYGHWAYIVLRTIHRRTTLERYAQTKQQNSFETIAAAYLQVKYTRSTYFRIGDFPCAMRKVCLLPVFRLRN